MEVTLVSGYSLVQLPPASMIPFICSPFLICFWAHYALYWGHYSINAFSFKGTSSYISLKKHEDFCGFFIISPYFTSYLWCSLSVFLCRHLFFLLTLFLTAPAPSSTFISLCSSILKYSYRLSLCLRKFAEIIPQDHT